MPRCRKTHVNAVLVGGSGRMYRGDNSVAEDVGSCPRLPGEGYSKCASICKQRHHAETAALEKAGDDARGGTMLISGIGRICRNCSDAMVKAGVGHVIFID